MEASTHGNNDFIRRWSDTRSVGCTDAYKVRTARCEAGEPGRDGSQDCHVTETGCTACFDDVGGRSSAGCWRVPSDRYSPPCDRGQHVAWRTGWVDAQQLRPGVGVLCVCPDCTTGHEQNHGTPLSMFEHSLS